MAVIGYARVSTQDQDLSIQLAALKAAGAERLFQEKVSGVRAIRPSLASMMKRIKPGDVVIVTKLDRLGRSTRELLELLEQIDKAGASFKSLGDPLIDTTSPHGRLLCTLLAAIAEFERELIRERTSAGRDNARARGKKFGRPNALNPHQRAEALRRYEAGETCKAIGLTYNVAESTIYRLVSV